MSYHSGNQLIDPYALFEKAHLRAGMHVADFGCGRTGHVVFPAATLLGERGGIYAVDIMKDVLEGIDKRAKLGGFVNVHSVWSNVEFVGKTAIPAGTLDIVFMVNLLSSCDNRHGVLEEAFRLLRPKGRIVIVDWSQKGLKFGPADERFVDFEDMKKWGEMKKFVVQEEFVVGKYHHGMIVYKHD